MSNQELRLQIEQIKACYPYSYDFHARLEKMSPQQVLTIFKRLRRKGQIR